MKENYSNNQLCISVVIPAYNVADHLEKLLKQIDSMVEHIIVVDDKCPQKSGNIAAESAMVDSRIHVIFHETNLGVGGAVKSGYLRALELESDIIVKLDGDGQMSPLNISELVRPLLNSEADYSKGNRFYDAGVFSKMPKLRLLGNLVLSFLSKLSTGYWDIFDPNNGFTSITAKTLKKLPLDKVDNRYFFESDMLFRLNLLSSSVIDVPLPAIYGDEKSGLSVTRSLFEFAYKHTRNFIKRIMYSYFLREFSLASLQLIFGSGLLLFGFTLGSINFVSGKIEGTSTPTGTLVLIAMAVLSGLQLLLSFFSYDMQRSFGRFSGNR